MFGVVAVTSKWSELYFVSFYLVTVVLMVYTIVAFVVDAFLTKYDSNTRFDKLDAEVAELFDSAQVCPNIY